MRATVSINAQGRMTVPSEIRRELGISGEATLIVETEAGRMIGRPAVLIPAEDAWAHAPRQRELLAAALAHAAARRLARPRPPRLAAPLRGGARRRRRRAPR